MNKLFNNNISLDKENHIYKLKSNPNINFTSVTTFIDKFFEKFDAQAIAEKLSSSHPKYMDKSTNEILLDWKKSADYGTKVHEEIENFILNTTPVREKMSIHGLRWLKSFISNGKFAVYPEVIIYSEELKLSGTIDLLIKNLETNKYIIMDWKTSRKIGKKAFYNKKGIHPASKNIDDTKFNHYSLQLSLYRFLLENYYEINIEGHAILHLKENECLRLNTKYMYNDVFNMTKHC